ncbi:MAG: LacI family DNA-binding transcriptional regulator [Sphaerochaetaceae bacterium]|jgi:LacI family transcriptional regulator
MVTIKDIAEKTGFSRGTVDRALHGRPGVNPQTVRVVMQVAAEMGYKANTAGVLLAARKKPTRIGCLLPDVGNDFFRDVMNGLAAAQKELSCYGLSLTVKHLRGFDEKKHLKGIDELLEDGCTALLLTTINSRRIRERIDELIDQGIPVACINTDVPSSKRLFYVGTDYYKSGRTIAGLLSMMAKTPQKIMIFTGSFDIFGHNERIRGFLECLAENSIGHEVLCQEQTLDDNIIGYKSACALFSDHPDVTTVFIVAGGVYGVCKALVESGLPAKPHVFSFDDIPDTVRYLKDGVIDATVTQWPYDQGYQGVKRLFDAIIEKNGNTNFVPRNRNLILSPLIYIKENIRSGSDTMEAL